MKVAGYIRVSTPEQAQSGEGLGTQKEFIENLIRDKGWTLYRIYSDAGISGSKSENRPELQQLLLDAKSKKFEAVIVSRLSRFGRSAKDLLNNVDLLKNIGITFISIKENIDLSSSQGRAMFGLFAVFAEFERDTIRETMSDSKMIKWRDHRIFNGKPPYGYFWNKETLKIEIHPEEKAVFEKIVDLYLNHGMSLKDIAIKLKEEEIICKRKPFNSSTLSYILKNPVYYGNYVVNQQMYKDGKRLKEKKDPSKHIPFQVEQIISKRMWDKIQEKTEFNKFKGKRITQANDLYLRDIIFCGHCGGRVRARFGTKRKDETAPSYYCCHWAQTSKKDLMANGREKCSLPHIPTQKLEDRIWQKILFHLMVRRDNYYDKIHAGKNYDSLVKAKMQDCKRIEKELARQQQAKENIYELLQDKDFNKTDLNFQLKKVQNRIFQLEHDYKDLKNQMLEAKELATNVENIRSFGRENQTKIGRELNALSAVDKKRLAENMFSTIMVFKDEKNKDGFNYKYRIDGPVNILGQLFNEGKLPSLNINSADDPARPAV